MSDFSKFQIMVYDWACNCFSSNIVENKNERNDRFLEEALELVQSLDMPKARAEKILNYVYSRGSGEPEQEAGGVGVTLSCLLSVNNISMGEAFALELERISCPEAISKIRNKQNKKAVIGVGSYTSRKSK